MSNEYILRIIDITKDYPGVRALDGVKLEVKRGEVHALVGENGAGKSTLIKILSGAVRKDEGDIFFDGANVEINSPQESQRLGISVIYQEFNLVPHLSVSENIFLGREMTRTPLGILHRKQEARKAEEILARLGVKLDPRTPVNRLSVAQQQIVEIAKVLCADAKLIAMDEPSSALTEREIESLFTLIEKLKSEGVSIIYISHRIDEVFQIADRVTVLRDGRWIGTFSVENISKDGLIEMMVGRKLNEEFPTRQTTIGKELLSLKGVTRKGIIEDISFELREGEILGITGLMGSGRTEVVRAIFAADEIDEGDIYLDGNKVKIKSPIDAIKMGISLLTEDRKAYGLILDMTVRENITLASLKNLSKFYVIKRHQEREAADRFINELRIKTPSREQTTGNLSGGNQQKVVLSKWLLANSRVVIFDEPTKGIDVGAKVEIYNLMNQLAESGVGIIMISSELPEILGMSDRIIVMYEGRIKAELSAENATQTQIMNYAALPDFVGKT
ncbi:sugar ABC transporter ATP-binding protein [Candidatus Poribacteria bacterium]|nr:sugar ABC transporter ATP-binding protein [Candidatus Poribacteria bacterium]